MSSFKLNLANVLDVEPAPVSCMSLNSDHRKLALFRGGSIGEIEIWDVAHQPFLEKVILDIETIEDKPSVESIIWANDRLFSCGLHGFVVEHNTSSGRIKSKSAATSGPVWCLAVNPEGTIIAAGTEDGFVNLFQIEEDALIYLKVLDRQEGRVLCLQWSPCGKYIATGSIDSVRLWDVEKGHAVQRLITGRTKNKETIVWSVLVLDDLTIVSGDSRGIISFWDGRIGVLKFKIQSHKADVLTLRLSKDKSSIYSAGVDPIVLILTKVGGNDKWVKSHPRNIHINDVLTLETYGNRLFSGGIDADLSMSSFPPKIIVKYPPLPKAPYIFATQNTKSLLIKQSRGISIWNLPTDQTELTKVLQLESRKHERIFSAGVNSTGTIFGYSTLNSLRFFQLSYSSTTSNLPTVRKLQLQDRLSEDTIDSDWDVMGYLHFVKENIAALVATNGKSISFLKVDVETDSVVHVKDEEIDFPSSDLGVGVISMSDNGKHICLTCDARIFVYSISEDLSVSQLCTLPNYNAQPTAIAFHPIQPFILVTYADHLLQIFNYKEGRIVFQESSKKKVDDLYPYLGATWSPNGRWAVLFQADNLYMLEMTPDEEPKKKSRKGASESDERFNFILKSCGTKYKYVAHVGVFNEGQEIVAVEVNPNSLLEKLPPSFVKKRFGA